MKPAPEDVEGMANALRELAAQAKHASNMVKTRKAAMRVLLHTREGRKSIQDTADLLGALYPSVCEAMAAMGPALGALNRLLKQAQRGRFQA
ncbi:hypothetical protein [Aerolutibacter ruishenii]|uniref:Uncharacterized protein n=1 Tax=Aerolutibacter ruishenii TaxID=686800 RepID=A0A562LYJ3_9GAMM|nr:hypothetical protein [Lysobacter ruishenii]TWI12714.1 hypothetical protein IP93_01059 [Lysobacter ruishenii]